MNELKLIPSGDPHNNLLNIIKKKIPSEIKNLNGVINAVIILMELASKIKNMSGFQKKSLVIDVLLSLVNMNNRKLILDINNFVPNLIDEFVNVNKQVYKFIKNKPCLGCF